jgi:DNA helicase-2/ATP-dependent DNA helicase PcrA
MKSNSDSVLPSLGGTLDRLDANQRTAATAPLGPVLVVAGAGSGKTAVFAARIAVNIERDGLPANEIVAITFTNKARDEMRSRLENVIGRRARQVRLSTFHGLGYRLIRADPGIAGCDTNPGFADTSRCHAVVSGLIEAGAIDADDRRELAELDDPATTVLGCILALKESGLDPGRIDEIRRRVRDLTAGDPDALDPVASELRDALTHWMSAGGAILRIALAIAADYQAILRADNTIDFADMLVCPVLALRRWPRYRTRIAGQISAVLVDEFQDTSALEFELIRHLCSGKAAPFVVGDDWQAIYGFRGGDVSNMLSFQTHFDAALRIDLERNYRSTPAIVDAAASVVSASSSGFMKAVKAIRAAPSRHDGIEILRCGDGEDEARTVIALARDRYLANAESVMVLVRAGWQFRLLERAAITARCPYQLVGGTPFAEREEVRDAVAYLDVLTNFEVAHAASWARVANTPSRGLGRATLDSLSRLATADAPCGFLAMAPDDLPSRARRGIAEWKTMRAAWCDAPDLLILLERCGYFGPCEPESADDTVDNIRDRIADVAALYGDLAQDVAALKQRLEMSTPPSADHPAANAPRVLMMTGHAAKGLEHDNVICAGWTEGVFPTKQALNAPLSSAIEEERRLAYVKITRARTRLTITAPGPVNRFVQDIPSELIARDPDTA